MFRTKAFAFVVMLVLASSVFASPDIQNIRFGILRAEPDGTYSFDVETKQIPLRLKKSGFRFGVAFDNPRGQEFTWYEIVRLPSAVRKVTGTLQKAADTTLRTDTQISDQLHVVDDFWFDKGDPVGQHQLELYVNGAKVFQVQFEVVAP